MKTTFKAVRKIKTTKEDGYLELTIKDYRGETTYKIDEGDDRLLIELLDTNANWQTKT